MNVCDDRNMRLQPYFRMMFHGIATKVNSHCPFTADKNNGHPVRALYLICWFRIQHTVKNSVKRMVNHNSILGWTLSARKEEWGSVIKESMYYIFTINLKHIYIYIKHGNGNELLNEYNYPKWIYIYIKNYMHKKKYESLLPLLTVISTVHGKLQ